MKVAALCLWPFDQPLFFLTGGAIPEGGRGAAAAPSAQGRGGDSKTETSAPQGVGTDWVSPQDQTARDKAQPHETTIL